MNKIEEQEAAEEFARRSELVMDEDDLNRAALREGALKMHEFWLRGVHLLRAYKGNRELAFDCFFMALGKGSEIGFESAVDISKHHFGHARKKAAVTKCIKYFQDRIGIPPMPGQRRDSGRGNMSKTRKDQLKK